MCIIQNIKLILFIACVATSTLVAQHTQTLIFHKHLIKSAKPYTVRTNYPTTGIVASINAKDEFTDAWIIINTDTIMGTPVKYKITDNFENRIRYRIDQSVKGILIVSVHTGDNRISRLIYIP